MVVGLRREFDDMLVELKLRCAQGEKGRKQRTLKREPMTERMTTANMEMMQL